MRWRRHFRYFDLPYVLLGAVIGWNFDVYCAVKGRSMLPTLNPGDHVLFVPRSLLCVAQWLFARPLLGVGVGDVVLVAISPELTVCKRVTRATANEMEVRLWHDAQFERPIGDELPEGCEAHECFDVATPVRSREWDACTERIERSTAWLWLEGDNAAESFDSRHAGAVPADCLRGVVFFRVWPMPGPLLPRADM